MATAFQPSAFQNNAFQIDGGIVPPVVPHPHGAALVTGRAKRRQRQHTIAAAFTLRVTWHAELESNDDDLALLLLLGA